MNIGFVGKTVLYKACNIHMPVAVLITCRILNLLLLKELNIQIDVFGLDNIQGIANSFTFGNISSFGPEATSLPCRILRTTRHGVLSTVRKKVTHYTDGHYYIMRDLQTYTWIVSATSSSSNK